DKDAVYPRFEFNTEVYTAGGFVEVESLSPLQKVAPNEFIEYAETWKLEKV
ncbi:MAG: hypothetical protein HC846_12575, partial [Blastocatellia bacterium]|nr:hypothetical protein [Blastocatellia bacterium]